MHLADPALRSEVADSGRGAPGRFRRKRRPSLGDANPMTVRISFSRARFVFQKSHCVLHTGG